MYFGASRLQYNLQCVGVFQKAHSKIFIQAEACNYSIAYFFLYFKSKEIPLKTRNLFHIPKVLFKGSSKIPISGVKKVNIMKSEAITAITATGSHIFLQGMGSFLKRMTS